MNNICTVCNDSGEVDSFGYTIACPRCIGRVNKFGDIIVSGLSYVKKAQIEQLCYYDSDENDEICLVCFDREPNCECIFCEECDDRSVLAVEGKEYCYKCGKKDHYLDVDDEELDEINAKELYCEAECIKHFFSYYEKRKGMKFRDCLDMFNKDYNAELKCERMEKLLLLK